MGCMGMSRKDFESCTPSEFAAIYDKWQKKEELCNRDQWERLRWQILYSLQPYCKKDLTVQDVLKLPWDQSKKEEPKEPVNAEETRRRYEQAKRKYGLE